VFDKMCESNVFSWSTMIIGYSKCGKIEYACQMFDEIPDRNMVSWNAMIVGFFAMGLQRKH
jgi:pentatricopeptide repeat protein